MMEFRYERAADHSAALRLVSQGGRAKYLGGGTNLVDLMREEIEHPDALIDVSRLSREIKVQQDGAILIGAAVTNTALAEHRAVRERFPLLSRAILSGASGQIRNMATVGGNLLQRTRCIYFYDRAARCNKRPPSSGCDAQGGFHRYHAILGASHACIATHPSDMCVALVALDAVVHLAGPNGNRKLAFADFHRLPGETPEVETNLDVGELITAVEVPALSFAARSTYRKVRDRSSYAFALISVAAALHMDEDSVQDVRLALGGVAHKPWRALKAEAVLRGAPATRDSFAAAAQAELADAVGLRDNAFKIDLARRTIVGVLEHLAGARP